MNADIRAAVTADLEAIVALHDAAFEGDAEGKLVARLAAEEPSVSLVCEQGGSIAGHIQFSAARLEESSGLSVMGLAPMAVQPGLQRRGIGGALVRAGLRRCDELGVDAVVVLGHSDYYPRFGFRPAHTFGLRCDYDVPAEVFMALELTPGCLDDVSGTVHYHPAFAEL